MRAPTPTQARPPTRGDGRRHPGPATARRTGRPVRRQHSRAGQFGPGPGSGSGPALRAGPVRPPGAAGLAAPGLSRPTRPSCGTVRRGRCPAALPAGPGPGEEDLLDSPGDWAPATTPLGVFHLVPVRLERDLPLLTQWMNDPAVAAFWDLAGPDVRHRRPSARPTRRRRPQRALLGRPRRHPHELLGDLPRGPGPAGPPLSRPAARHRHPSAHRRRRRPRPGRRDHPAQGRRRPDHRQPSRTAPA